MVWRPFWKVCGVQLFWFAWPAVGLDWWQVVQAVVAGPPSVSSSWLAHGAAPALNVVATAEL